VQRLSRGGEVLAPGYADRAIQTIDARDLADFALLPNSGVFHVASPHKTFGEFLEEIAAHVAPPGTKLTWIDPQPLLDEGHDAESFPLWYAGDDDDAMVNTADPAAAIAAGLHLRPLKATIDDLAGEPEAEFLDADDEADLLRRLA
jgi:2'-hydroxyisoflavone reductase